MNKLSFFSLSKAVVLLGGLILTSSTAIAQTYEVTIKNLTKAQSFTPSLVVTHRDSIQLFEPGTAADTNLETLAEEGDTSGFESALADIPQVIDVQTSSGLNPAGGEVKLTIDGNRRGVISVLAMLIPTNDAFYAVRGITLPRKVGSKVSQLAYAWDAGTEVNDELCSSIPGPDFKECDGAGGGASVTGGEEGFIHIHSGIQGVGDLSIKRDFNNPVALVTVERIRK